MDIEIIKAAPGKVFQRKKDGMIYGSEIALGYTYYIGGEKLKKPHKDTAEDFIEIDDPNIQKEEPKEESVN